LWNREAGRNVFCRLQSHIDKEADHMYQNYHDLYRGEVYYATPEPAFGHEQGVTSPVLFLQMIWATGELRTFPSADAF